MSSPFPRFAQRYKVTSRVGSVSDFLPTDMGLELADGYREFMREYAGATFNEGLYRVHPFDQRAKWNKLIAEAFPAHTGQLLTFAYDWMGRQFALDARRSENGEPLVLLFDPGFGEALEVPTTFLAFHEEELLDHADAALADTVFEEWRQAGHPGPGPTECVGYRISPLLGGEDQLQNNEIGDMEVYWSLNAQIIAQAGPVAAGSPIRSIKID